MYAAFITYIKDYTFIVGFTSELNFIPLIYFHISPKTPEFTQTLYTGAKKVQYWLFYTAKRCHICIYIPNQTQQEAIKAISYPRPEWNHIGPENQLNIFEY